MRDCDYHLVISVHIFRIELGCHLNNLRAALVTVFVFDFHKFGVDNVVTQFFACQQLVQMGNQFLDFFVLGFQLVNTQTRQRAQTHIHNRLRLQVVEVETFLQVCLGICRSTARTDDTDHLVNVINSDDQAFQDMRLLLCLA